MDTKQLDEWEELAEKAPSAPWIHWITTGGCDMVTQDGDTPDAMFNIVGFPRKYSDRVTAAFIAAARTAVPALIAEVRRLQIELDAYRNPIIHVPQSEEGD